MNNADKIRQMTDGELATLLSRSWHSAEYEDDDYDPEIFEWLKEPAEGQLPARQLTFDELQNMDGQTVWVPESEEYYEGYGIVDVERGNVWSRGEGYYPFCDYGLWTAYTRKPDATT